MSRSRAAWRDALHDVIFEADTPAGKAFDVFLFVLIILSVIAVILESVAGIRARFGPFLRAAEWTFTIIFTIEYVVRIITAGNALRYTTSFFGIVDLLAIVPTYLSVVFAGSQSLIVIRALRLLRVFRVLKLAHFLGGSRELGLALRSSFHKIVVFLVTVVTLVLIIGAVMYLVEGEENGFANIPQSIYWAVVTMTTVGYGDIVPQTELGRFLAAIVMIIGYGIIAVPTGIVTVELANARGRGFTTQVCPQCMAEGHDPDAKHCKYCGTML